MEENCKSCYFYGEAAAVCKRWPPEKDSPQPRVRPDDWCGEYEHKMSQEEMMHALIARADNILAAMEAHAK